MQHKRIIGILLTVVFLLCIPLVAMQFTDEVMWTFVDFVVMAVMLLGAGFIYEIVMRKVHKIQHWIILIVALLSVFLLTWAELAVGIFGTPLSGQ